MIFIETALYVLAMVLLKDKISVDTVVLMTGLYLILLDMDVIWTQFKAALRRLGGKKDGNTERRSEQNTDGMGHQE